MARLSEWSKEVDSSSTVQEYSWVQIPQRAAFFPHYSFLRCRCVLHSHLVSSLLRLGEYEHPSRRIPVLPVRERRNATLRKGLQEWVECCGAELTV